MLKFQLQESPDGVWDACSAIISQFAENPNAEADIHILRINNKNGTITISMIDSQTLTEINGETLQEVIINYANQL